MPRLRKWTGLLLFGLTAYLAAESLQPPDLQPSARASLGSIAVYQSVFSPLLGPCGFRCRYRPTCSAYARQTIEREGTFRGLIRAAGRLWRCSPWGGGPDP